MLKPGILLCLLVALAGCSTASRRAGDSSTDWNFNSATNVPIAEAEHVSEGPQVAPPPVTEPVHPAVAPQRETWIPLERWSRENHFGSVRRLAVAPMPVYSLTTTGGVLTFQIKSLVAKWNGLVFDLGFEPQLIDGQPFLHALDIEKNIKPLLCDFQIPAATNRVIVIDPGHGGMNAGAKSLADGHDEKEFTLDWARRLARLLATNGWQVFLTRTNDVDVSLSNRVAFAEEHKADLFISLHFNSAAPNQQQAGLETYCLTPSGMSSTLKREFEDDPSLVFSNNGFDEQNFLFAMNLHRVLVKDMAMSDRGVRRARFLGVLRGQNRPAILIEGGFLSNPAEARRIADPAFREKLAEAVANALGQRSEVRSQKSEVGPLTSSAPCPAANKNALLR